MLSPAILRFSLRQHCRVLCLACLVFTVALFACPGTEARAATTFYPGFKTLGLWQESDELRVDLNVWYPSSRRPTEVNYAPWTLLVARNGREVEGRFPLLLLSHDSAGTRFSHHETAAALARSGFVVAALTHSNDNANHMPNLFNLRQLTQRVAQLRSTLDVLLAHPDISASIDPQRIGIMGFGAGGTAALLLGGALPQKEGWAGYCERVGSQDPYCSTWAVGRMHHLVASLPLKASLADTRIKAVAAIAPAYGMLFAPPALRYFYPPLLLLRADKDTINRAPWHADALRQSLAATPERKAETRFTGIADIDSAGLMSACPPLLQKDIPELCGRASFSTRRKAHKELNTQLSQFFLDTLGDTKDVPAIPAPPDLTPPPPPKPEVKEKPAPEKKKTRREREGRNRTQSRSTTGQP